MDTGESNLTQFEALYYLFNTCSSFILPVLNKVTYVSAHLLSCLLKNLVNSNFV